MDQETNISGWRGSAELWLNAAHDALIEGGVDTVRIQPLAKRLALSRTSFYWFFENREALLAALLERWSQTNTASIVRRSGADAPGVTQAMLNVFDCWLDPALFDHRLEFAVRSWALQSEEVLARVQEADGKRLGALAAMFERFGYAAGEADVRARTVYLVQIGYISMQTRETVQTRMDRMADYVTIFTGRAPEADELRRFRARHS